MITAGALRAHSLSATTSNAMHISRWPRHGLLERGADLNWVGWDDLTPLDVAVQAGHKKFADWLLDQGAKPASELSS
jgi:hypothetical protein